MSRLSQEDAKCDRTGEWLVELRGFRTSDLRSAGTRALHSAAASGSAGLTVEGAPLDPALDRRCFKSPVEVRASVHRRSSPRPSSYHSRGHLYVTSYTEGFSHFVASMTVPVASGWSGRRVGTRTHWKAPPCHGAHVKRTLRIAAVAAGGRRSIVLNAIERLPRWGGGATVLPIRGP